METCNCQLLCIPDSLRSVDGQHSSTWDLWPRIEADQPALEGSVVWWWSKSNCKWYPAYQSARALFTLFIRNSNYYQLSKINIKNHQNKSWFLWSNGEQWSPWSSSDAPQGRASGRQHELLARWGQASEKFGTTKRWPDGIATDSYG